MATKRAQSTGTDEDLIHAASVTMALLDARPVATYVERCQSLVAVGICAAPKFGINGKYPCANPVGQDGVFCEGPCRPLWTFEGKAK